MDRYAMTQDGNNLVVDTGGMTTGPDRGVQDFLTPPKGPSCLGKA